MLFGDDTNDIMSVGFADSPDYQSHARLSAPHAMYYINDDGALTYNRKITRCNIAQPHD